MGHDLFLPGIYVLFVLKQRSRHDHTHVVPSSPILLYLFRGRCRAKKNHLMLVYWINSAAGKLKTLSFTPYKPHELYLS